MKNKVEMRPAYEWTCDNCGQNNFESAIILEMSDEDKLVLAKDLGIVDENATEIPLEKDGDPMSCPDIVICSNCEDEFETFHYSEDIE